MLTLHDAFGAAAATAGAAATQAEPATITPAPHGTPPASSSHEPPEPEPLTDDERQAIQTAGLLYSFIAAHVVSDGDSGTCRASNRTQSDPAAQGLG